MSNSTNTTKVLVSVLTLQRLREILHYAPDTGIFRWRITRPGWIRAGRVAGSLSSSTGYRRIQIDTVLHQAHRLVWLYVHGKWPKAEIDHINGNRADNWLSNLREADRFENTQHLTVLKSNNTSGYRGVTRTRDGKWVANVRTHGRNHYLGRFDTAKEAGEVAATERRRMFGAAGQ